MSGVLVVVIWKDLLIRHSCVVRSIRDIALCHRV